MNDFRRYDTAGTTSRSASRQMSVSLPFWDFEIKYRWPFLHCALNHTTCKITDKNSNQSNTEKTLRAEFKFWKKQSPSRRTCRGEAGKASGNRSHVQGHPSRKHELTLRLHIGGARRFVRVGSRHEQCLDNNLVNDASASGKSGRHDGSPRQYRFCQTLMAASNKN